MGKIKAVYSDLNSMLGEHKITVFGQQWDAFDFTIFIIVILCLLLIVGIGIALCFCFGER